MIAVEVSPEEYKDKEMEFCSVFDSPDFSLLNARKVDRVRYLLFEHSKPVFGLTLGERDGALLAPFSAPFAFFSSLKLAPRVSDFSESAIALVEYGRSSGCKSISLTIPPPVYGEDRIAKAANALHVNGFALANADLNHHLSLSPSVDSYIAGLDVKARQKYRTSLKMGLSFGVARNEPEKRSAFQVIEQNRAEKGYPLRLSFEDLTRTSSVVNVKFFLVADSSNQPVASAVCYATTPTVAQVIYWGGISSSEKLRPMNYLAANLFEHFRNEGFATLDIGPSTGDSIPNAGLCDFKQSIGASATLKLSFSRDLGQRVQ